MDIFGWLGFRNKSGEDEKLLTAQQQAVQDQFEYDNHILFPQAYIKHMQSSSADSEKDFLTKYGIDSLEGNIWRVDYSYVARETEGTIQAQYLVRGDKDHIEIEKIGDSIVTKTPKYFL